MNWIDCVVRSLERYYQKVLILSRITSVKWFIMRFVGFVNERAKCEAAIPMAITIL